MLSISIDYHAYYQIHVIKNQYEDRKQDIHEQYHTIHSPNQSNNLVIVYLSIHHCLSTIIHQ